MFEEAPREYANRKPSVDFGNAALNQSCSDFIPHLDVASPKPVPNWIGNTFHKALT
jgi:hypothetical protein